MKYKYEIFNEENILVAVSNYEIDDSILDILANNKYEVRGVKK